MAMTKDRYGNNLRRGLRVKDLSDDERGAGEVVGSSHDGSVLIRWESDGEETSVAGESVVVTDRAFGR